MRLDFSTTDVIQPTYSVDQLNREVRSLLEGTYGSLWVDAEVTEVTHARSGHIYFTLIDPGGSAQLRSVMWRGQAKRYGSLVNKGVGIRCHGKLTLYEARGTYQFVVDRAEEVGAGVKARILAERKAMLEAEGLFATERKRPLPPVPSCVGVVTSRSGAALQDIIKVLARRFPVRLVLAHAQVQGDSAPGEIVDALGLLAKADDVEVVIVGRGGGSAEDLDAFNAEEVVRAVAAHPCPVISAVGHEVDVTLVDLAADRRAATPSEAAEIVVPEAQVLAAQLSSSNRALQRAFHRQISLKRERLSGQNGRLKGNDPRVRLRRGIERLARADERLARWPEMTLVHERGRLKSLASELNVLSPLASLARGYSVVRRLSDGTIVRKAVDAPVGSSIDVKLADGSLVCQVGESKPETSILILEEDE
jgi:exodeoxyribonuclease VII large subunit